MYLIYGNENFFIEENLSKITTENINILDRYTFDETEDYQTILTTLDSVNLFNNKKIVIIKNLPLLYNNKKDEQKCVEFIDVLKNNKEDIIIFSLYEPKIKTFKPSMLFQYISKQTKAIQCNSLKDWELEKFIISYVASKKAYIDKEAVRELISKFPNNLFILTNEIKKYLITTQHITIQHVKDDDISISDNVEFALSDALIKKQSNDSIMTKYNEQIMMGVPPALIIGQIANLFNSAQQIYILKQMNNNLKQIGLILNMHEYRVQLINNYLVQTGIESIKQYIEKLAQIDIDIKSGLLDEFNALNYFIMQIIK
ncbi:DNA polymerase III subunit delta [Mycoplasma phocoenae]|uniref:DNA polymerase III subunit delta n=1 Tax=Mycoplasma phocoenae TaxID=754517 RepID=A0A858U8P8_9MOLU|nr:hypothetical protein [Mycoplasma phocoenae]QJG67108.1 hypothetical protein HGG69_02170 [Mycoplasma phocoenae]